MSLLPIGALIIALVLGYRAWTERGIAITVILDQGHGLKTGDLVRYRGIGVGEVDDIALAPGLEGVRATIRLNPWAGDLARVGSLFWVVRPEVGLAGITGLDTLVGSRYLEVVPGHGAPQRNFIAQRQPPVAGALERGGLDIVVQADRQGSLHAGAPVIYRGVQVGTVASVGLARDGSAVEGRVHIGAPFVDLVRDHSQFWDAGHIDVEAGLTGVHLHIDSLATVVTGGVAFATPPGGSASVATGFRFTLHDRPTAEWLAWKSDVVLNRGLLPSGLALPRPLQATLVWKGAHWWSRQAQRESGWLLPLDDGLLGPADLLMPPVSAGHVGANLSVGGLTWPLSVPPTWVDGGLALRDLPTTFERWSRTRVRRAQVPEDIILVGDPSIEPQAIAAVRLHRSGDQWLLDPSLSVDPGWYGAVAVSCRDGCVLGFLILKQGIASIAVIPPQLFSVNGSTDGSRKGGASPPVHPGPRVHP